jgi:hypothetical protein
LAASRFNSTPNATSVSSPSHVEIKTAPTHIPPFHPNITENTKSDSESSPPPSFHAYQAE